MCRTSVWETGGGAGFRRWVAGGTCNCLDGHDKVPRGYKIEKRNNLLIAVPTLMLRSFWIAICIAGVMFQAALATASVESELAFHQGVAAYGEGRLDEARARFERVVEEAPDDAAALQYLNLISTHVTDEGVENLQQSLPDCKIIH